MEWIRERLGRVLSFFLGRPCQTDFYLFFLFFEKNRFLSDGDGLGLVLGRILSWAMTRPVVLEPTSVNGGVLNGPRDIPIVTGRVHGPAR